MGTGPASVRVAIVGAGLMGRWHAHAIQRAGSRVVAIVDRDATRASALASQLSSRPAVESDLAIAIREHRVHVVHVCTPLDSHEAVARTAMQAGAHVLMEKPLAPTTAAVESLYRAASEHGVLLCPVHQFLFQRGVLDAQRVLPDLGLVCNFDVVACSAGADRGDEATRESVALDILPHGLALARRLLDVPLATLAWTVGHGTGGELRLTADSGATSIMLVVSMRARPTENSLTIRCEKGTVRADLFHGFSTIDKGSATRWDKIGRPFLSSSNVLGAATANLLGRAARGEPAYPGLRELVQQFHLATTGAGREPISVDESIDVCRVRDIVAELRSARPR